MAIETELTRRFGLRHPIVSAPMGAVAGGRLAAAVSRAGGLGLIGPGYLGADWIEAELAAAGGERVGIGFITWDLARAPQRLDVALAHHPAAVMLSFGDPEPFLPAIRRAGVPVMLQVQTLAAARQAAALGADLIVAQGTEAGGHGAQRALLPLLPAVVDAVAPIPVLGAGGIADGRGLVAALALGAQGILVGTRFAASAEALGLAAAKARLVESGGDATLRTRVFDIVRGLPWPSGWNGRAIRNAFTERWHGREEALQAARDAEQRRYAEAAQAGDLDTALVWAGEGVDLVRDVPPAAAIVAAIAGDAERVLRALARHQPGSG
ncbi:nitronate monooxygenase [bacterium]|nr:nitronate monooxygenase [bacterium]